MQGTDGSAVLGAGAVCGVEMVTATDAVIMDQCVSIRLEGLILKLIEHHATSTRTLD